MNHHFVVETEAGAVAKASGAEEVVNGRKLEDVELLAGVRRNDLRALCRFVERFEPLLRDQARRLGVNRSERRNVVTGFLDDMLVKLATSPVSQVPRSLSSFVVTSFRNVVADIHRDLLMRERQSRGQEEFLGSQHVVRAGCSEFALRSAEGPSFGEEISAAAATVFVKKLVETCSRDERQLLVWTAHRVPLRECARWLGISYESAKQRIFRLRVRLLRESAVHLAGLSDQDRAAVERLLSRAGVRTDNDTTRGTAA
ncbi:MAG: hypothetical protein M3R65_00450 [Gemmatimonadota bacterium]|nr:hypothetical protein [Gemmatimonadota bacterium]